MSNASWIVIVFLFVCAAQFSGDLEAANAKLAAVAAAAERGAPPSEILRIVKP